MTLDPVEATDIDTSNDPDAAEFVFAPEPSLLVLETGEATPEQILGHYDGLDPEEADEPVEFDTQSSAGGAPRGSTWSRWLTDLADACRSVPSVRVVETSEWKTRGHGPMGSSAGVMIHHTATSASATGNMPTLGVLQRGHGNLKGPIANLGIGRDGTVYVIAAGRAYHAGATYETWQSNSHCIGIEVEGDGKTPFTSAQLATIFTVTATLLAWYKNQIPDRVCTHKMAAKQHFRKTDPFGLPQDELRAKVLASSKSHMPPVIDTTATVTATRAAVGVPKLLKVDGYYGGITHSTFMWAADGDVLEGMTRANVRDAQTFAGRPRTGQYSRADYEAIQRKVGAPVDGDWPWRWGDERPSVTTTRLQEHINELIKDAS